MNNKQRPVAEITKERFMSALVSVSNAAFYAGDTASHQVSDKEMVRCRLGDTFSEAVDRVFEAGPVIKEHLADRILGGEKQTAFSRDMISAALRMSAATP